MRTFGIYTSPICLFLGLANVFANVFCYEVEHGVEVVVGAPALAEVRMRVSNEPRRSLHSRLTLLTLVTVVALLTFLMLRCFRSAVNEKTMLRSRRLAGGDPSCESELAEQRGKLLQLQQLIRQGEMIIDRIGGAQAHQLKYLADQARNLVDEAIILLEQKNFGEQRNTLMRYQQLINQQRLIAEEMPGAYELLNVLEQLREVGDEAIMIAEFQG